MNNTIKRLILLVLYSGIQVFGTFCILLNFPENDIEAFCITIYLIVGILSWIYIELAILFGDD